MYICVFVNSEGHLMSERDDNSFAELFFPLDTQPRVLPALLPHSTTVFSYTSTIVFLECVKVYFWFLYILNTWSCLLPVLLPHFFIFLFQVRTLLYFWSRSKCISDLCILVYISLLSFHYFFWISFEYFFSCMCPCLFGLVSCMHHVVLILHEHFH